MIGWCLRQIYCCFKRKYTKVKEDTIPSHKLPWVWVGMDNNSVTDVLNYGVTYNQTIDINYLEEFTQLSGGKWTYIDPLTLEQKDFPRSGFVIEDDSR